MSVELCTLLSTAFLSDDSHVSFLLLYFMRLECTYAQRPIYALDLMHPHLTLTLT
jgi:hypothetical protein